MNTIPEDPCKTDFDGSYIYVYSLNVKQNKIYCYGGYYLGPMDFCGFYENYAYLMPTKEQKRSIPFSTWIRKIPIYEGEYYNEAVWFRKPNIEKAKTIFIAEHHKTIINLMDKIDRQNEVIRMIANMEVENK